VTPLELQDEAREILLRREFQDPGKSIVDRVLDWIGAKIANFFEGIFGGLFAGDTSGFAVLIMLIAAGVLGYVLVKALRRRTVGPTGVEAGPETDILERRSAQEWLRVARASEQAGDFRGAVRSYYRAATTVLVDTGNLSGAPGLTARQAEREAALRNDAERDALADMTGVFEDVWYGGSEADAEVARRVASDAARVGAHGP